MRVAEINLLVDLPDHVPCNLDEVLTFVLEHRALAAEKKQRRHSRRKAGPTDANSLRDRLWDSFNNRFDHERLVSASVYHNKDEDGEWTEIKDLADKGCSQEQTYEEFEKGSK